MRKIPVKITNKIQVENIEGYYKHRVTKFGTSAKIDCPKKYLGKQVIVLILDENEN